ncbi:hypothetical protein Nepgr_027166 [Nepenthes gracilis]|uniref:Uncharacterized protein n=1 Tax=Nepenthes gracilis TaxID=150966 RepID=A0AAD3T8G8_NEPGR|nr:hypothetical protein Nepgr_027166 [Nepenthes gracilis]
MDCSSREVFSPSRPQGPPPFHDSSHPALRLDPSTSPAIHPFPPLQKAPLSPSPGPDAIFLASMKLDCSLPESSNGISVRSKESAPHDDAPRIPPQRLDRIVSAVDGVQVADCFCPIWLAEDGRFGLRLDGSG